MIRQKLEYLKRQLANMEEGQKKNVAFTVMLPPNNRRKKRVRKRSFTEALKEKYCIHDPNKMYTSGFVVNIFVTGKPKTNESDPELAYLRNVVLNDCAVGHAGLPSEGLVSVCPNVVDLDLSSNCLSNWKDVLEIWSHLKCLKFVNIARNPLKNTDKILDTWNGILPEIENLVLNDTGITWPEVLLVAKRINTLKELHICGNDYEEITDNDLLTKHLNNLQCLRINNNNIQRWNEIWKLKNLPSLESLILSGNPLQHIYYDNESDRSSRGSCECMESQEGQQQTSSSAEMSTERAIDEIVDVLVSSTFKKIEESMQSSDEKDSADNGPNNGSERKESDNVKRKCSCTSKEQNIPFPKLKLLCVSETKLSDWSHMAALNLYPELESVRIKDVPLMSKLPPEDRRKLHIASLPKIKILNGSEISTTERDKAERHFLRYFMDKKKKPQRFYQLEDKHGKLQPLVDVDLGRSNYKEWINLTLKYKNQEVVEHMQAKEAVGKIRLVVAERFNLFASVKLLKLYHSPCGPCHREGDELELQELIRRTESLPMSRFDIMDGDIIYVDAPDESNTAEAKKKGTFSQPSVGAENVEKPETSGTEHTRDILKKLEDSVSLQTNKRKREDSESECITTEENIRHFRHMASYTGLHSINEPAILSLDISPKDSTKIVTGGEDNSAVIFSKELGQVMVILQGHTDEVSNVIFHTSEDVVISSSMDCTVKVWDIDSSKCLRTISKHCGPVSAMCLHGTGDFVLTSSLDKTSAFTDLREGNVLLKFNTAEDSQVCTCTDFHPQGLLFANGMNDGNVTMWDLRTRETTAGLTGHKGSITDLSFMEDGNSLATCAEDSSIKLWDVRTMDCFHTITLPEDQLTKSLCFNRNCEFLATAGSAIRFYSCKDWQELKVLTEHKSTITNVKFSDDTSYLVSSNVRGSLKFYSEA